MTLEQRKAGKKERIRKLLEKLRTPEPQPINGEDELREVVGLPEEEAMQQEKE